MSDYYDRAGNQVASYVEAFSGDKKVAFDTVDDYRVSTVHLGLNHNFGDGPPLIFETMVFKGGSWNDLYCDRYSTEEQAVAGHREVVEKLSAGALDLYGDTA